MNQEELQQVRNNILERKKDNSLNQLIFKHFETKKSIERKHLIFQDFIKKQEAERLFQKELYNKEISKAENFNNELIYQIEKIFDTLSLKDIISNFTFFNAIGSFNDKILRKFCFELFNGSIKFVDKSIFEKNIDLFLTDIELVELKVFDLHIRESQTTNGISFIYNQEKSFEDYYIYYALLVLENTEGKKIYFKSTYNSKYYDYFEFNSNYEITKEEAIKLIKR